MGTALAVNTLGTGIANIGQSFTLSAATTITSVTLRARATYSTALTLYAGAGNAGTALTAALPIAFTAGTATTVALPAPLSVGDGVYSLVLAVGNGLSAHNNVYNGGAVYLGTNVQPAFDLEFTVAFGVGPGTAPYAGAGSVGVGTYAPTATLDVAGSTRLRGLTTAGVVTTDANGNLSSVAAPSGANAIQNQTTQQPSSNFNISGNGTVGGTLTATNAVVTSALTGSGDNIGTTTGLGVRADGGLNIGQNTSGNNVFLGYATGGGSTGVKNLFIGYGAGSRSTSGNNNVFSGYASGNGNLTGGYNTFEGAFSSNANTGGNFNAFFGAAAGVYTTTGGNNTAVGAYSGPADGSGALDNATAPGANVTLTTSNTVVLGNGANVGIGTPAPTAGLHVLMGTGGAIGGTGVLINGPATGNPNIELRGGSAAVTPYVDFAETNPVDYSTRLISQSGVLNVSTPSNTTNTIFRVNGSATITGTLTVNSTVYNSDARFKQNVRPLASALAGVLALRGVRYEWNALGVAHGGRAGVPQVGLLAQELKKVYPELVSTDQNGYKAVNYAQLAPVLIEALKEQQRQLEALQ